MVMIFEMQHQLWLDAIFLEKTCWQKKPCWQTKGNVNMAEWTIWTPQQTTPYRYMKFDCSRLQLCVLSYEKQHWVNDINTNNQPMWSLIVRASSYRNYLICCEKQLDTGTGKLGKLCSGKKASRRKWKSEN